MNWFVNSTTALALLAILSLAVGESIAQNTTAPAQLKIEVVLMSQKREPSDAERLLASVEAIRHAALTAKDKSLAIDLMKPWVERVIQPVYQPEWQKVEWQLARDAELGDVFIGEYKTDAGTVRLVDTACVLLMEFKLPKVDVPPEKQEVAYWRQIVGTVCQGAENIFHASRLGIWRAPDAVYYAPHADQVAAGDTTGWRNVIDVKVSKGCVLLRVVKLIDGERPADASYGIRSRLHPYAEKLWVKITLNVYITVDHYVLKLQFPI